VNTVMNHQYPRKAGNFLTCSETISFSSTTLLHGVNELVMLRYAMLLNGDKRSGYYLQSVSLFRLRTLVPPRVWICVS